MRAGVPRTVSGKAGRARGHCTHPGLGALLTVSISRAGLGLTGGQFGFEDDIRSAMTGPSRDTVLKQHIQHSQAKPRPM